MNSALGLTMLLALIASASCIICLYRTCAEEPPCREVTPEACPGRIARNASICLGCCDVCIRFIEPGEPCSGHDWTRYIYRECNPDHYCDRDSTQTCLPYREPILVKKQDVDV